MWIFGVGLAIVAAVNGSAAKQLIAASTHLEKAWMFHLGVLLNVLAGPVLNVASFACAPQVVVAPFGCLDIVFTTISAPYTLPWQNHKLTRLHYIGIICVVAASFSIPIVAHVENKKLALDDFHQQLLRFQSRMYILSEVFLIGLLYTLAATLNNSKMVAGASALLAGVFCGNIFIAKGTLHALEVGIAADHTKKGNEGQGDEIWRRPTLYVFGLLALLLALVGHHFLKRALSKASAVVVVTVFVGVQIFANCLSGMVVMSEMVGAPWWRYCLYYFCLLTILSGLYFISMESATLEYGRTAGKDGSEKGQTIGRSHEENIESGVDNTKGSNGKVFLSESIPVSVTQCKPILLGSTRRSLLAEEIAMAQHSIMIFGSYTDMASCKVIVPLLAECIKDKPRLKVNYYYEIYPFDEESSAIEPYVLSHLGKHSQRIPRNLRANLRAGFPWLQSETTHFKVSVFDDCRVLYDSGNFMEGCCYLNDSRAPDLADTWVPVHFAEFGVFVSLGAPMPQLGRWMQGIGKRSSACMDMVKLQLEDNCEIWLLPRGVTGRSELLAELLENRERIVIANMQLWPSGAFRNALERRLGVGASLDVCGSTLSSSTVQKAYGKTNRFYARVLGRAGKVTYREWIGDRMLHAKIIILDDDTVVLPSFNISRKALEVSVEDETLFVLRGEHGRAQASMLLDLIADQTEVQLERRPCRVCPGLSAYAIERLL